jgi:hypothetical protein
VQSNATKAAAALLPILSFATFAGPKWLPTTYAPDLSKTAAYAAYRMDRFNYKYGRSSYFLLAAARQSATQLSHTNFSQLSEPTQGESVWAGSGVSKATQLLVLLTLADLPLLHH